ncbi:hypothetical protein ISG33_11630 [Glaciecola sp. MH2013]|uniref:hypothetical protein n=1 Tax=Glaciecola sp. MH2013 TaxID=2785524 RepID=UPI00189F5DA9|nr:hypothetical protein [Glaciecola sp. MH2013]MBF7074050.1 hypothetical protein [Glaciecola sp. MH2013]
MFSSLLLSVLLYGALPALGDDVQLDEKLERHSYTCIAESIADIDLAQTIKDTADWHFQLGHATFSNENSEHNLQILANSAQVEPFKDMPLERLLAHVKDDVTPAMISLLQRPDADVEDQYPVAEQLVLQGHTGVALSYLMRFELISAKVKLEIEKDVTSTIKEHIIKALSYVAYGNQRLDNQVLTNYLEFTLSNGYPTTLHHSQVISENDYQAIAKQTSLLSIRVDSYRADNNYISLNEADIPVAAYHTADLLLASAYLTVPSYIESLKLQDIKGKLLLTKNDCVQKVIDILAIQYSSE